VASERDPDLYLMLAGYHLILASVPTEQQPREHGPLTLDEIDQAGELMDRLADRIQRERAEQGDT
jgi:hypothetical protein